MDVNERIRVLMNERGWTPYQKFDGLFYARNPLEASFSAVSAQ